MVVFYVNRNWKSKREVNSVTRLGDFLKFLVLNFLTKVTQKFGDYLAILKTSPLSQNNCWYFLVNLFLKKGSFSFDIWSLTLKGNSKKFCELGSA